jgi:cyclopropane fatty-acyl-phospholipid synthase-like methyltransferase
MADLPSFESRSARTGRRATEFNAAYEGRPPWEIGHAQPALAALAALASQAALATPPGCLLDIGCGTGELAMLAASRGYDATGVDQATTAIAIARQRAADRNLSVEFRVENALALPPEWSECFDLVLDSGVFHIFADDERPAFVRNVRDVLKPGGMYAMLCFSDRQPGDWGPRRVSEAEIRSSFADGWHIDSIEPAELELTGREPISPAGAQMPPSAQGLLAQMTRA